MDLMDGFDAKACVYDEKKEKRYHATVWIVIMVCMILVLFRGLLWHVEEIHIAATWQKTEAEYNEKSGYAYYYDTDGREKQCSLDGYEPQIKDGKVILYFSEDMTEIHPVNTFWFWGKVYLFLGGMIAICIWRITKVYKKTNHSEQTPSET